jgi:hypothetical protein
MATRRLPTPSGPTNSSDPPSRSAPTRSSSRSRTAEWPTSRGSNTIPPGSRRVLISGATFAQTASATLSSDSRAETTATRWGSFWAMIRKRLRTRRWNATDSSSKRVSRKPVEALLRASTRSRDSRRIQVQDQGEGGLQPAQDHFPQPVQHAVADALGALVGPGGIVEPVQQYHLALLQHRPDETGHMLGPVRVEQHQFRLRGPGLARRVGVPGAGRGFPCPGRCRPVPWTPPPALRKDEGRSASLWIWVDLPEPSTPSMVMSNPANEPPCDLMPAQDIRSASSGAPGNYRFRLRLHYPEKGPILF